MIVAVLGVAVAAAAEDGTWTEVRVGTAAWQASTVNHGGMTRIYPRINGHVAVDRAFTERRTQLVAGLHIGGYRYVWRGFTDRGNVGLRGEPHIGVRVGQGNHFHLQATVGPSVDFNAGLDFNGRVYLGTVTNGVVGWTGKGERVRPVVSLEARLAPIVWSTSTLVFCPEGCNQSWTYNPGGTGVLLNAGAHFR